MKNLRNTVFAATSFALCSIGFAQAPASAVPPAPTPQASAAPADPLPQANPKFFTAATPTVETVNAFLKALWGYDTNRIYRVMGIQSTPAPGIAKVTVFVTDKTPNAKVQSASFYVTPDGKHAIGEAAGVISFGATPFADLRALLQQRATGASRGAESKDLLLVEFADLQCPHCKEAQATMDQIAKDFPKARIVFQLFPLVDIHASAFKAAAFGVCAQKQSSEAFFKYAAAVFDTQDALTPTTDDAVLKAAATRAGLDATAIAACAATQATKDAVAADLKLGEEAGVDQTPLLAVNGRMLPITAIPYEAIKQIIVYQAQLDGVPTGAAPDVLTPKPAAPTLSTLPQ